MIMNISTIIIIMIIIMIMIMIMIMIIVIVISIAPQLDFDILHLFAATCLVGPAKN